MFIRRLPWEIVQGHLGRLWRKLHVSIVGTGLQALLLVISSQFLPVEPAARFAYFISGQITFVCDHVYTWNHPNVGNRRLQIWLISTPWLKFVPISVLVSNFNGMMQQHVADMTDSRPLAFIVALLLCFPVNYLANNYFVHCDHLAMKLRRSIACLINRLTDARLQAA